MNSDDIRKEVELAELQFLRKSVAVMRELGVLEFHGIRLDPDWLAPAQVVKKRTPKEQDAITLKWNKYRTELEESQIDGTAAPEPPKDPEHLDE